MVPVLFVAHGGLGLLALIAGFLPAKWSRRVLVFFCLVGVGVGVTVAVLGVQGDSWRSTELSDTAVIAGAASALAWLVAAVVAASRGRAVACALVGVAASSLTIAATSRWAVLVLLFWICSSLAIAVLAGTGKRPAPVWAALFLSDAGLVAALVGHWMDERAWDLPASLEGWPLYVLLLAVAIRGGAVPALGVWGALGAAAPVLPLSIGGAFVLLPVALGPADPWAGSALFTLATIGGVWGLLRSRVFVPAAASVPIALLLGAVVVFPAGLVAGGLGALLTAAVLAMWRTAGEYGGADRSFALTALPPWIGFVAVIGAAAAAVEELAGAEDVVDKVPWTLVVVLAPAALAASVAVAAHAAKGATGTGQWWIALRGRRAEAWALLASRFVLIAGVAGGMVPGEWLGLDSEFASWDSRRTILFGTAITLGLVAAFVVRRRPAPSLEQEVALAWSAPAPQPGSLPARVLVWISLTLAIAGIAAVSWFTFEGLRLGFL